MIKNKLVTLYNWLLTSTFKNQWFNNNVKYEITNIINCIIYPHYRKENLPIIIKRNRLFFAIFGVFILWTSLTYSLGRYVSYLEKKEDIISLEYKLDETNDILYQTNKHLNKKDLTISQLRKTMNSRDYLQFVIKRDCKLISYDNLTKVSDTVFFTMIDEVDKYKIPYTIFFRVIDRESGFKFIYNNRGSGAFGYCQIMPVTYEYFSKRLNFSEHNEITNIKTGAYILKHGYNYYRSKGYSDSLSWYKELVDYSGGNRKLALSEMKYLKTNLGK